MSAKFHALEYIGDGSFLPGVPSRNLSLNEVKHYGRKRLLDSGLYVEFEKKMDKQAEDRENKSLTPDIENKESQHDN